MQVGWGGRYCPHLATPDAPVRTGDLPTHQLFSQVSRLHPHNLWPCMAPLHQPDNGLYYPGLGERVRTRAGCGRGLRQAAEEV